MLRSRCDDDELNLQEAVVEGQPPRWKKKDNIPELTKSYMNYMIKDTLKDFAATVLQVSDTPYDEESVENMPTHSYEFCNGYNQFFGQERLRVPEGLFDASIIKVSMISCANPIVSLSSAAI